jgi:hypothetical protein
MRSMKTVRKMIRTEGFFMRGDYARCQASLPAFGLLGGVFFPKHTNFARL